MNNKIKNICQLKKSISVYKPNKELMLLENNKIPENKTSIKSKNTNPEIHGVCVCVNFGDYLDYTLSYNNPIFNSITIATCSNDIITQNVCKKYKVNMVITDRFFENNDPFNKGKGLNDAIKKMDKSNWICIFDADMIFPPVQQFLHKLNKMYLYGIRRRNIKKKFYNTDIRITHNIGERKVKRVIGFCQIFHSSSLDEEKIRYSENCKTAQRSDVLFNDFWDRASRKVITGITCYHLSDEEINWSGRVSPRFNEHPI